MVRLERLCVGYPGQTLLRDVSLDFCPGQVLVLAGPNGCGKSTLLRTVLGILPKHGGRVLLDGRPMEEYTAREVARQIAYLPQSRPVPNITAKRLVLHGRFPYLSYPRHYRPEDWQAVETALGQVGAEPLGDMPLPQLSGGQRQRIYLAMALAQDAGTILMDEPTTYLDAACQIEMMELSRRLAAEGRAVVMVLHDLCLAMRCADRLGVLAEGCLQQADTPEAVFAGDVLQKAMGVTMGRVMTDSGWQYYYAGRRNG